MEALTMPFVGSGHIWLIAIVLVIVLIIWGPGKLPDVGSGLGRAIREFRKASTETREEFTKATRLEDPAASPPAASGPPPIDASQAPVQNAPVVPVQPASVGAGAAAAPAAERSAGEGDHTSPG
jgi:TatA/E family protein of Tat protein translocase